MPLQGPDKAIEDGADPEVVRSLKLAISSFNHFDKDGKGSLTQVRPFMSYQHWLDRSLEAFAGHCTCIISKKESLNLGNANFIASIQIHNHMRALKSFRDCLTTELWFRLLPL